MPDVAEAVHDLAARLLLLDASDVTTLGVLRAELANLIATGTLGEELAQLAHAGLSHLTSALSADEAVRADEIDEAARVLATMTGRESIGAPPSPAPRPRPVSLSSPKLESIAPRRASVPTPTLSTPAALDDWTAKPDQAAPPPSRRVLSERPKPRVSAPPAGGPAALRVPDAQDRELVGEFIVEARQYLTDAESALLELEAHPEDKEAIGRVFRAFHTIKGVAALLGFDGIAAFAHAAEGLLAKMRDGQIRCAGRNATLALRSIDALRVCIGKVELSLTSGVSVDLPAGLEGLASALGRPDTNAKPASNDPPAEAPPEPELASQAETPQARAGGAKAEGDSGWMRVRTDRLDRLIDMVGELVIAQSMVSQDPVPLLPQHEEFRKKVAHGAKIVRELQDLSMSLRMVPLKSTFQRLTRVVRDVVQRTAKDVRFVTEGDETEIDRNMVDVVSDPLVHMVRNAVDHGIETREQRVAAGKPPQGTVKMAAFHSGGNLVLRLVDDGKGMDRAVIAAKAVEKGIIQSDVGMTDSDVFALIFEPGFSTRDAVTDVSGRGVGMDVVKRGVEALKGRIETTTVLGQGTTFTIHVPLTLAITDGMLVRVGKERFILPTVSIRTSFRPSKDMLSKVAGRGEFVRVRDEFVTVFRLHHMFGIEEAEKDPTKALIIVVDCGEGRSAFLVDELLAQQQVVSKGLSSSLLAVPGVAGGAILGDGRVGLILDPPGLVALAHQTDGWVNAA